MRSDTNVETRTRLDGRQSLTRRRFTRVTNSGVNGAFENDLALAMQESLRYAKQEEANKKRKQEENIIERNGLDVQNKVGEVTMSGRACMESPQGPKQLKELLLLHVDLVQHQQELLSQKDKAIKALHEERTALTCRLDRMERRMSLLKQKDDYSDIQNKSFGSPNSCAQSASKTTHEQASTSVDRGTKRKSAGLEPQNLTKRFTAEAQKPLASSTPSHRTERHQRYRNRSATVSSTVSSTLSIDPATSNTASSRKNRRSAKCIRDSPDNSVLRTSDPYYVAYYEPPDSEDIDLESRGDIVQGAQKELQVELPQWQNRTYTNLWVLEGTENLEDEVFLKRHQKPEIEEKRRKRWDLQRIREQKIYEKLKEKERGEVCTKDEGQQSTLESFYPSLDNITHIEVTNKIPVMVFGHPVPNLDKMEFSLPWELETSACAHPSRSSRSSRHT
ncbi:Male-specific lethal 1-like 1 [Mizuhopecten yessoensis]|uniref:Male-specific lethal 1-like 1 n=2 Tax=Mizuhopecten yessoensis TaxID=6573 RepID=A0A210PW41_MIZYE|nr:Male-specific lethal 1-like 1 [Mizuhopecten yessoensis]